MIEVKCIQRKKYNNNKIKLYEIQDKLGNIKYMLPNTLKNNIKSGIVSVENLKLTSDNKLIFTDNKPKNKLSKFDRYKAYVSKQKLLNSTIFDFTVDEDKNILILKYYDVPERTEVVIPNFVDGFMTFISVNENNNNRSPFYKCTYLNKIITGPNIKGNIDYLFFEFEGNKLDLSEFDTSNITSMNGTFCKCITNELNLGGKFNTSKVHTMQQMFNCCTATKMDLGDNFDTSNVGDMYAMFNACYAEEINLGDKFDTSNVVNMGYMFRRSHATKIDLGNKFNTNNVKDMCEMFFTTNLAYLDLGDKFYTRGVLNMYQMFYKCMAREIKLGVNFDTRRVTNMALMFSDTIIEEINLGSKFVFNKTLTMSMFSDTNIKTIYISENTPPKTITTLIEMANKNKIKLVYN